MENCKNCNAEIIKTTFKKVTLFDKDNVEFINEMLEKDSENYCSKCGNELLDQAGSKLISLKKQINQYIFDNIEKMPVISIHTPFNWEYDVLGIVTGQTTTGTGVVAEFTSSFTDFFGKQSGAYNKKLSQGEKIALGQMRSKALNIGGNAIIATDLDYAEVGAAKGMLMVCATGTAINLKNLEVLKPEVVEILNTINKYIEKEKYLKKKFKKFYFE